MKAKLFLVLIFTVVVCFEQLTAQPKIEFVKERLNFGEIDSEQVISLVFEFKNSGDKTLVIKSVVPDCGCTALNLEKVDYRPGETGRISVKFDSTGFNGKVIKGITVYTNDEKRKSVILYIEGIVVNRNVIKVILQPEELKLGKLKVGQSVSKTVSIESAGNKTLQLVEYTVDPEISISFQKKFLKPGEKTTIKITFTAIEKGEFNYLVKIRTNNVLKLYEIVKVNAHVE